MKTKFNKTIKDQYKAFVIISINNKFIFNVDDMAWEKLEQCLTEAVSDLLEKTPDTYLINKDISLIGYETNKDLFDSMEDEEKKTLNSKTFKLCEIKFSRSIEIIYDYQIEKEIWW